MNELIVRWLQDCGVNIDAQPWVYWCVTVGGIALAVYAADVLCRRAIIPLVKKVIRHTRMSWDDILFNDELLRDCSHLIPPILIAVLMPFAFSHEDPVLKFLLKVNAVYLVAVFAKMLCTFLSSLYELSNRQDRLKNHPLKGIYQMLKIVVICIALIIVVSILVNKNPTSVLAALGASAAVLMLVFKDTIMGLVAGVQLSANDMLRPGDWITMPKYGADGEFGSETEKALKAFQRKIGITQDGLYGSETHQALMDAVADDDEGKTDSAPDTETPEEATPSVKRVRIVCGSGSVNIRVGNDTKYGRITSVKDGTTFEWIATAENGWHAIVVNAQIGWVSGKYSEVT